MTYVRIEDQLKTSLAKCTHIVIKLGTGVLNPHIEKTDFSFFKKLADEVKYLQSSGKKVLIVSSGAVGFGKKIRSKRISALKSTASEIIMGNSLVDKQAYAAIGQSFLINTYTEYLDKVGLDAAQILLSMSDFKNRHHFQNLKQTLDQLLDWGSVPVINENDTVSIDEKFGDNDTISALIAGMYQQSCLIILTTIDGFYMDNKKVDIVQDVESDHLKAAGGASIGGIGGMRTKLYAARKIIQSGQIMNIASGKDPGIIRKIVLGENVGTWFIPLTLEPVGAKKRWLLHYRHARGQLFVDDGARQAIVVKGASLLIVGLKSFNGEFEKGDVVSICDVQGEVLGLGIVSVSSESLNNLLGGNVEKKGIEIIHRDNLALMTKK
ncbi:MAG: glutamate 5-kinase [Spirochaetia bacterium]|nr:glutamate 5-kinase [Spirochaetia bacterium]